MIRFTVTGNPESKDRPRIVRIGQHSRMANTKKTVAYEARVAALASAAMGGRPIYDCPLTIRVVARFAPVVSASKKARVDMLLGLQPPAKGVDGDNVLKVITDACNGVVYRDDALIVDWRITKVYAEVAGVDVVIAPYVPPHPRDWNITQEAVI